MGKAEIRQKILAKRKLLDPLRYQELSLLAQQSLICSDCFRLAAKVALYSPINKEVETGTIFSAAVKLGKQVFYPKVVEDHLQFKEVNSLGDLLPGTYAIPEPGAGRSIGIEDLDLIVVPGVAFDLFGNRLGYGRGFYDRFLVEGTRKNVSVGLCFEFQLWDLLPAEVHDLRLMYLATEAKFIPCHESGAGSS
ncbi:MAG: 5-formyltetrahydrofolate cyclo-ligase [Deltaproteobacteria bacterium]|jgi:5-formyltetrahydrofolate cyclo-ligase|nr:5-formyltetrahydrofolate cyclo-ligase [Deltaproteobacteria bacterium]